MQVCIDVMTEHSGMKLLLPTDILLLFTHGNAKFSSLSNEGGEREICSCPDENCLSSGCDAY